MTQPSDNKETLRELMEQYRLTRADVARILGLAPKPGRSHGTVDGWLAGRHAIPSAKLELIRVKAPTYQRPKNLFRILPP